MKFFTLSEKPLIAKKREGVFFLLIMPGMLLGAIIILLPTIFSAMPYKEGVLLSIPEEWWSIFAISLRSFMAAGAVYFMWLLWFIASRLTKDGYIDVLWEHSQKLRAEKETR